MNGRLFLPSLLILLTACTHLPLGETPTPVLPTATPAPYAHCAETPCNLSLWYIKGTPAKTALFKNIATQYEQHQNQKGYKTTITLHEIENYQHYLELLARTQNTDEAPDILLMRSDWLHDYQRKKIVPLTEDLYNTLSPNSNTTTLATFVQQFYPAFLKTYYNQTRNQLYAIPLYHFGFGLAIHQTLLNRYQSLHPDTSLTLPTDNTPPQWDDIISLAEQLATLPSPEGNSTIPGIAMSHRDTVPYLTEIFFSLILQHRIPITTVDNTLTYHQSSYLTESAQILAFFHTIGESWRKTIPGSARDAFRQGKVGMMFVRAQDVIQFQQEGVPMQVYPFPQTLKQKKYWAVPTIGWNLAVNGTSKQSTLAWDFLLYCAQPKQLAAIAIAMQLPTTSISVAADIAEDKTYSPLLASFNQQLPYYHTSLESFLEEHEQLFLKALSTYQQNPTHANAKTILQTLASEQQAILDQYSIDP